MGLREILAEDRRLAILRLLAADPDYAINESVMQSALASLGHGVGRDVVRADFAWLAEMGLVEVNVVGETINVAKLTGRGADVAAGRSTVPGVQRPRPS